MIGRVSPHVLSLVVLVSACHETSPPPSGEAPSGEASAAPARTATPSSTPTAAARPHAAASASPAPSGSAFSKVPTVLKLSNGSSLTVPPPARVKTSSTAVKRLPSMVKEAKVFEMGSEKRLLMVNELDMEGKDCAALLSEQEAKMKQAKADTNDERLQFRRVQSSEVVDIDGHKVLFGQSLHKGVSATDDQPFVGSASAVVCRDGTYMMILFMSRAEEDEGAPKKLLMDVVKSFEPQAG